MLKTVYIAGLLGLLATVSGCAPAMEELIQTRQWDRAETRCEQFKPDRSLACYRQLLAAARETQDHAKMQRYIEKTALSNDATWAKRIIYYEGGCLIDPAVERKQIKQSSHLKQYAQVLNRYMKIMHYVGRGPKSIKYGEGRFYQAAEKYFDLKRRLIKQGFQVEVMDYRRFNVQDAWSQALDSRQYNVYFYDIFCVRADDTGGRNSCQLSTETRLFSVQQPHDEAPLVDRDPRWYYELFKTGSPALFFSVASGKFGGKTFQRELDRFVCEAFIEMQEQKRAAWQKLKQAFPDRFKD